MLATTHAEIHRYEREERAREVLRGSRLCVVDAHESVSDIEDALSWAAAEVVRCASLEEVVRALASSDRIDAVVVDALTSDREGQRRLQRVDPSLAIVLLGRAPKAARRLQLAFASGTEVPILDRPAARFELLEFAAAAVDETRRARGRRAERSLDRSGGGQDCVDRPQPDAWSCELVRERICYWSIHAGLSERESQVLRGVVRRLKNHEIATQLGITVHAVKKYLREVLHKLALESRHEVAWLLERTPEVDSALVGD